LPVGETGGASGGAGFAGTRLQDPKGPKLGGSRSAARPGRSPKPATATAGGSKTWNRTSCSWWRSRWGRTRAEQRP